MSIFLARILRLFLIIFLAFLNTICSGFASETKVITPTGLVPTAHEKKWVNRIGNQSCRPCLYSEPQTFDELCNDIKQTALQGHALRVLGNGYSISDIGCTDGCLLSLKHLKKILFIDTEKKLVRVEAGITIQELNEQLAPYGLALSNQAAIAQITLGGALSTGVHGTGHTGSLSSFVREFELITADGNLHTLSLMSDPDAFAAVSVGLGSLGVIYAVTLQCESLFYLYAYSEVTDRENIVKNYKTLHKSNDFFQFLWNVTTDKVVVNRWNRCKHATHHNDLVHECVASYKTLPWYVIDENDKDLFSEFAIPIDFLPNVLEMIKQFIQKYKEVGAKITDINVRFVEQDAHAYLSPSSDGPVAYIALCILEEDTHLAFYKEFEEVMSTYHGRPHWGKINFLDYDKAINLYGTNLQKFINVKHKLDPQGVFSNSFTDRILGCEK